MQNLHFSKEFIHQSIPAAPSAVLDCVINEKCCSVDGGRGIFPLFSSHPREFAIQGKKNANARGLARRVGGGGSWAQLELTDALVHGFGLKIEM